MELETLRLTPPAGWEVQTNVLLLEPHADGGASSFRTNIQIGTRRIAGEVDLEAHGAEQAKKLERDVGAAEICAQGITEAGGRRSYELGYLFELDGRSVCQVQFFLEMAGRLIAFTGTAAAERYDSLRAQVVGVIESVEAADA